jgi:hypothetical protein
MAVSTVSPMMGWLPAAIPKRQKPLPSGEMASWLMGTLMVTPLKAKLTRRGLELKEQGTYAWLGEFEYGVAPTKAQMEVASGDGSCVMVVPESMRMRRGDELANVTGLPEASVPVTLFKSKVKSTTPGKPFKPDG